MITIEIVTPQSTESCGQRAKTPPAKAGGVSIGTWLVSGDWGKIMDMLAEVYEDGQVVLAEDADIDENAKDLWLAFGNGVKHPVSIGGLDNTAYWLDI